MTGRENPYLHVHIDTHSVFFCVLNQHICVMAVQVGQP
nr:hypothetical protein [Citrobacter portucalensis]